MSMYSKEARHILKLHEAQANSMMDDKAIALYAELDLVKHALENYSSLIEALEMMMPLARQGAAGARIDKNLVYARDVLAKAKSDPAPLPEIED
jgi:hypothetical protein